MLGHPARSSRLSGSELPLLLLLDSTPSQSGGPSGFLAELFHLCPGLYFSLVNLFLAKLSNLKKFFTVSA